MAKKKSKQAAVFPETNDKLQELKPDKESGDGQLLTTNHGVKINESGNTTFAFYAIAYRGKIKLKGSIKPQPAKPEHVQLHYADYILKKLSTLL
jgi:hypothetical protein